MPSDTPQPLFAARVPIFPRRVTGYFRRLKWWIMGLTLGIYYLTPWLRWNRGENLPDQAVLIDMVHRRFYFFWIEIWPHEFYFVAGLLIMAGLGLFLFTSALGRVWCGYTCPQTVWVDLFIWVERRLEGDRNARIRLWNAPWSAHKWRLRLTKWAVWLVISVATGGAWVFYFADAPTLAGQIARLEAAPVVWISVAVLTATTFVFGGFMREQVCNYMCPWPRIQAAMMDDDTITVAFRSWRGEPRGKHRKGARAAAATRHATAYATPESALPEAESAQSGDCIDCMACVNVCPAGIDIRDGQQMECITCALCIDACDDIMAKIGKPRGLIDYLALSDEPLERAGEPPIPVRRHIFRLRTMIYTALWTAIGVGLVVALVLRPGVEMSVSPIRNPTFVVQSDGAVRNIYDVRLRNKAGDDRVFLLSVTSDAALILEVQDGTGDSVIVPADSSLSVRVYVTAAPGTAAAFASSVPVRIAVEDTVTTESAATGTTFNGRGTR